MQQYELKIQLDETFTYLKIGFDLTTISTKLNKIMLILTHVLVIKDNDFCAFTLKFNKEYQLHIFTLLVELLVLSYLVECHKLYDTIQVLPIKDLSYRFISYLETNVDTKKEFMDILKNKYNVNSTKLNSPNYEKIIEFYSSIKELFEFLM